MSPVPRFQSPQSPRCMHNGGSDSWWRYHCHCPQLCQHALRGWYPYNAPTWADMDWHLQSPVAHDWNIWVQDRGSGGWRWERYIKRSKRTNRFCTELLHIVLSLGMLLVLAPRGSMEWDGGGVVTSAVMATADMCISAVDTHRGSVWFAVKS